MEEVLLVICSREKGVAYLHDARRTVECPEGDGLHDEERYEEEEKIEIVIRDALFLDGIENLRDDERQEEGDDIGDDEKRDKEDDVPPVSFRECPCFFGEIDDGIIGHREKTFEWIADTSPEIIFSSCIPEGCEGK